MTKTGPNGIVHAFFIPSSTHMTRTGPTDASFFKNYSCVSSLLNYVYRDIYYRGFDGLMGGYDEGNGPKRRVRRRLGHW